MRCGRPRLKIVQPPSWSPEVVELIFNRRDERMIARRWRHRMRLILTARRERSPLMNALEDPCDWHAAQLKEQKRFIL